MMTLQWYRQDREAVLAALARGERPDMATTLSAGVVDELVALHGELGILAALDAVTTMRQRAGVPDGVLLRTLATLPFVAGASLSGAAETLVKEPAILLRLGWAPLHLREGTNRRHRHPEGRQAESLPCHPDTLRDALRRVATTAWEKVQRTGVQALYTHKLVRGHVYAVDGSGIGPALRLVALVCVSAERPLIVAAASLGGGRLRERQRGERDPSAGRAGHGGGGRRVHPPAVGRCALRRWAVVGLAQVRQRHRRPGAVARGPPPL